VNTVRCVCTEINALLLAAMGIGCDGQAKQQLPPPGPQTQSPPYETTVTPIVTRQIDLPVKEGTMPLVYLVETKGGVRIVDMTNGHSLAKTIVPGRSIVSIDEQRGVSIGGTVFVPGPLVAEDRYGVYFDAGGFTPEDDIRTTVERSDPPISQEFKQSSGSANGVSTTRTSTGGMSTGGPSPHH
jgi:hypothetical protein